MRARCSALLRGNIRTSRFHSAPISFQGNPRKHANRTVTREADFTLPLHGVLHRELHPPRIRNAKKFKDMRNETAGRKIAAQTRVRRERPHPLTHRASRKPWGRSRLMALDCAPGLGRRKKFRNEKNKGDKDGLHQKTTRERRTHPATREARQ